MNEAQREFRKLMDGVEKQVAEARALGESIDFLDQPFDDEQLQDISRLGIKFNLIGQTLVTASDMMADLLMEEVVESTGISMDELLREAARQRGERN